MHAATFFDGEGWRDGTVETADGRMLLHDRPPTPDLPILDGVVIGAFTDHHVHLQLVDHALLGSSALGRVVDLGANPSAVAALSRRLAPASGADTLPREMENAPETADSGAFSISHAHPHAPPGHGVAVEFAGAFLTAVGGYPSDRDWAPAGSFREIASPADAETAVSEMADAGASRIKVASNATAGPVLDDDLFRAIVHAAAARGLPVVAHTEGPGEAQRAARLGATRLAHAPFTERLGDRDIAEHAAAVTWVSTLAIHDGAARAIAVDNVRHFHRSGGTVLYGTDLGNGPMPVGLNPRELAALREAGIDGDELLRALTPADPRDPASVLLRLPGVDADPALARPLTRDDLKA